MILPYQKIWSICKDTPEVFIDIGVSRCDDLDDYELCITSVGVKGCEEPPPLTPNVTTVGCGCPMPVYERTCGETLPINECLVIYSPLYLGEDGELVFRFDDALYDLPKGRYKATLSVVDGGCHDILYEFFFDLCMRSKRVRAVSAPIRIACCS